MLDTARSAQGRAAPTLGGDTAPTLDHPLSLRGDRESEAVMAEFQAAVDAGQMAQACRLLVGQTLGQTLVAVGEDADLLRSSAFLVKQALDSHPQMRELLREQYLEVGNLRVTRAIAAEDVEALDSLSLQFHGMGPGIEANLFLADRDLALGRFLAAADRYAALLDAAQIADRRAVAAKHRLAWAMLGESRGEPIKGTVELGDRAFRGNEFEDMISSLIRQAEGAKDRAAADPKPIKPGKVGQQELLSLNHEDTSGQLFIAGDRAAIIHKNFIDAVNLKTRTHRRIGDPKKPGPAEGTRPLLLENGLVCRWRNGELKRFGDDGKQVWSTRVDGGVVSDPVLIGRWVYVLSRGRSIGRRTTVNLSRIDISNGAVVQSGRLIEVASTRPIEAGTPLVTERGLLFGLASTVVATDSSGQVVWVRRLPHIPESIDASLYRPGPGVSLRLAGPTLVVAAEGSPDVLGINPDTGGLMWRRTLPDAGRLVGVVDGVAVLEAPRQMIAISAADGGLHWRLNVPDSHGTKFIASADQILRVRFTDAGEGSVAWIDPGTGTVQEEALPQGERRRLHMLGPWGDRLVAVTRFDKGPARIMVLQRR